MERRLSPSLAERLKTETGALHTAAERSTFMGLLLRGRMARPAYCALLRNLHAIYAALEPALARHASHAMIAPIYEPALCRTRALEDDLQCLHGADWRDAFALQHATRAYADRVKRIEAGESGLLLAHAYVRYLGDLSGGQMLGRIVARSMGLSDAAGTRFYDFGDAACAQARAQAFRTGLGRVVCGPAAIDALVGEAALSFRLHRQLFDELALATGLGT